jgi:hypothetical protein
VLDEPQVLLDELFVDVDEYSGLVHGIGKKDYSIW